MVWTTPLDIGSLIKLDTRWLPQKCRPTRQSPRPGPEAARPARPPRPSTSRARPARPTRPWRSAACRSDRLRRAPTRAGSSARGATPRASARSGGWP
eukprot:scaffold51241_cov64-Phaeocystis_antarctica.AAC.5